MKIAIIGAGAAGCFAAANIPYREGQEVTVFEKTGKVMQKVKVSGGGRCNVTHDCTDVPELLTRYPRGKQVLRKSLYHFTPSDTIRWFGERGVALKTEADGRMFPVTDDAQTIIDCIWQQMMRNKVNVVYHKSVTGLSTSASQFTLSFADGTTYIADRVLIATGGYPKADQYHWLTACGHTIQEPVPSLFTFNIPNHPVTELMGVSVPMATVKIAGTKLAQSGPLLITHWGMSGPAVLKTSAVGARELADRGYTFSFMVNWLHDAGDNDVKDMIQQMRREQGKQLVQYKNPFDLPKRLWEYILTQCGIKDDVRWGELPATGQNKLVEMLVRDAYPVKGKTTFKEEFVTCGGITLAEIDPQSMQSKIHPGLYFAGETMDVDGITGGYNFQNAWCSAWIAAHNMIS